MLMMEAVGEQFLTDSLGSSELLIFHVHCLCFIVWPLVAGEAFSDFCMIIYVTIF